MALFNQLILANWFLATVWVLTLLGNLIRDHLHPTGCRTFVSDTSVNFIFWYYCTRNVNESLDEVFFSRWPRADTEFNREVELNFDLSIHESPISSCAFSHAYVWLIKAKFLHFFEKPHNPLLVRMLPGVLIIIRNAVATTAEILWILWICRNQFGIA